MADEIFNIQNSIKSEGEDNEVHVVFKYDYKIWSIEREKILIELIEKEVKKGSRPTIIFFKEAWKTIRSELIRLSSKYTKNQVRNKFNQLRSQHNNFGKLLKETSVGYVAVIEQFTASKETWQHLYGILFFLLKMLVNYDQNFIINE